MDLPPLVLDRDGRAPLAVQLADALRAAARAGAVRVGDRLPSTRSLAVDLGVSRTVTAAAYDQLLAEGWVAGRHGAGTFVVAVPPRACADRARQRTPTRRGAGRERAAPVDLRPGHALRGGAGPGRLAAGLARGRRRAARRRARRGRPAGVPRARSSSTCCGTAAWPPIPAPSWRRAAPPRRSPSWPGTLPRGARVAVEEPGYQRAAAALRGCRARRAPGAGRRRRAGRRRPAGRASRPSTARRRTSSRSARGCRRRGGSRWWRGRGPRGSWSSRTTTTASCATTSPRCRCSPRWARTSSCTWAPRASC